MMIVVMRLWGLREDDLWVRKKGACWFFDEEMMMMADEDDWAKECKKMVKKGAVGDED